MGNPEAKAAAKKRKEDRLARKAAGHGGKRRGKHMGTARKHIKGTRDGNTQDPRVK